MTAVELSNNTVSQVLELIRVGQVADGCRIMADAMRDSIGYDVTSMDVARLLWNAAYHDDSIQVYRHAMEAADGDTEVMGELAQKYYELRRWQELGEIAEVLRKREPTEARWYGYLAWSYFYTDDTEKCSDIIATGLTQARNGVDFQAGVLVKPLGPVQESLILASNSRATETADRITQQYEQLCVMTWRPSTIGATGIRLVGATTNLPEGCRPFFELTSSGGGKPIRIDAAADVEGPVSLWHADAGNLDNSAGYTVELRAQTDNRLALGDCVHFTPRLHTVAETTTVDGIRCGNVSAVLAGAVGGTNLATRYHFRWGYAGDALDNRTDPRWVPPGRSNWVTQQTVDGPQEWLFYAVGRKVIGNDGAPESPNAFATRLTSPFGKDRNHLNGIGITDLLFGWYGRWLSPTDSPPEGRAHCRDLRDAEVTVTIRPKGLNAKGFLFACNVQSFTGRTGFGDSEESAPWTLSDQLVDCRSLDEEAWNTLRFTFPNSPRAWTFCGNNPAEQPNAARYGHAPIDQVLSRQRGNLWFWFVLGDWRDPPEGAIDIRSIGLRFRNWSILSPDMGAELTACPVESMTDPGHLTGGVVGDLDEMWFSGPNPGTAQEFVWRLAADLTPTLVRLHQNPLKPARTVEILGSVDGHRFETLVRYDLADSPSTREAPMPTHLALSGNALRWLKLVIHSGFRDDLWGLDAIEIFDDNAHPLPELAPASVSEEIKGLEPGQTIYYQLIAENDAGVTEGLVSAIELPETNAPSILNTRCLRQSVDRVTLFVESIPSGLDTEIRAHVTGPSGAEGRTSQSIGNNRAVRHAALVVDCAGMQGDYQAEITAVNEAGESAPYVLRWEYDDS